MPFGTPPVPIGRRTPTAPGLVDKAQHFGE
jgi:hypothetical protein